MIQNNENKSLCSSCMKKCCDHLPGGVFPEQLGEVTVENIKKYLENGYCLDWWEGDPRIYIDRKARIEELKALNKAITTGDWSEIDNKEYSEFTGTAYYIRPKIVGFENRLKHSSWANEGSCVFLTDHGCAHQFEDRPLECQALIPKEENGKKCCYNPTKYNKQQACVAWLPYQELIEQAIKELKS